MVIELVRSLLGALRPEALRPEATEYLISTFFKYNVIAWIDGFATSHALHGDGLMSY